MEEEEEEEGLKGTERARKERQAYRRGRIGGRGEVYFVHLPFCGKGGLEAV